MRRNSGPFAISLMCGALVALLAAGCAKQDDRSAPEVALGDQPGALMPIGRPAVDLSLLADQTSVTLVKKVEIKYGPLKRGGEAESGAAAPEDAATPTKKAGKPKKGESETAGAEPAKPHKRTKIGSALSSAMGVISRRGSSAPPAAAEEAPAKGVDEESGAPAKPAAPAVKLVDPRGTPAEIPPAPPGVTPEQLTAVRAAARADAIKNLMKVAYSLPLEPPGNTVGKAIGQSPDKFPNEPDGVNVFDAKWSDDQTLEVEVEITIGQLTKSLSTTFEGVSFDPLSSLDQGKAITAKGSAKVPGGKGEDAGAKKPPKRAAGKGGGKKA